MYRSQNGIFILEYPGAFEEHRNTLLINSISSLRSDINEKKAKGVLLSLQNAKAQGHTKELKQLIELLEKLNKKIPIIFGFVDYDATLYHLLRELTKETQLKLFKNFSAARLFLDSKAYKEGMEVMVFDDDEANTKKLASELSKFGYSVIVPKSAEEFHNLIGENRYNIYVTQSSLNIQSGCKKAPEQGSLNLSKKLISNLPVFMDTAVETLVSFTGLEAQKSSHSIKCFDTNIKTEMLCAIMRFKGDVEGVFVLIFPLALAHIAMEAMLGEKVGEKDYDTLKDGVGELCNIITGGSKSILSQKDIKVTFELPRTHMSLKSAFNDIGDSNGIWIDMQLASKPFYMFITG
jgi:CheY-specific phosphatase CheX